MPQHSGNLLLPRRPEHLQRFCHLPLASQGSAKRTSLVPPARNVDMHVLARYHVRPSPAKEKGTEANNNHSVCIAGVVRLYYTHLYLVSYDVFCTSSSPPPPTSNPLTMHPGHGASTFIIMSVESGVGVACGCLPGCKPLMNRMFPRIFASTSQSSSYPRPSAAAQARFAAKNLEASGSSGAESYHMQSLRSNGQGMVVDEKLTALPAPPPSSRQGVRTPARVVFGRGERTQRRYGVLDDASDSSTEMIILQRRSEDQRERNWDKMGQKV